MFTVMLLSLLLAGCGIRADETQGKDDAEVTLSFMMPQSHYKDFLKEELALFEKEHPGCHIEVLRIPDNQWIEVVKAKAAVGEMTDLIRIDRGLLQDIGTDKFVEFDERESWYDRIREDSLDNKLIDGKLYGLPIGGNSSLGIICNRDLFDQLELEPPVNMEELRLVCARIREAGYTPLYASDKDAWTVQIGFSTAASQITSQETWDRLKTNRLKWSQVDEYVTILEEFLSLRTDGFTNSDYLEATYAGAVEAMADGEIAMYLSGQFFVNDVLKVNPDRRLLMVPGPYNGQILTVVNGPGLFAVSAKSDYVEEARVFLDWFSQPEPMERFHQGWSHQPVFQDEEPQQGDWQQYLYDNYITQGKTAHEIDEIFSGIDLNDFWNYQQEMMMGSMDAREVLEKWDASFAEQMSNKGMPGW